MGFHIYPTVGGIAHCRMIKAYADMLMSAWNSITRSHNETNVVQLRLDWSRRPSTQSPRTLSESGDGSRTSLRGTGWE